MWAGSPGSEKDATVPPAGLQFNTLTRHFEYFLHLKVK